MNFKDDYFTIMDEMEKEFRPYQYDIYESYKKREVNSEFINTFQENYTEYLDSVNSIDEAFEFFKDYDPSLKKVFHEAKLSGYRLEDLDIYTLYNLAFEDYILEFFADYALELQEYLVEEVWKMD